MRSMDSARHPSVLGGKWKMGNSDSLFTAPINESHLRSRSGTEMSRLTFILFLISRRARRARRLFGISSASDARRQLEPKVACDL